MIRRYNKNFLELVIKTGNLRLLMKKKKEGERKIGEKKEGSNKGGLKDLNLSLPVIRRNGQRRSDS